MTLQASGPISFSQIANEFGLPPGKNLGAYRISTPQIGSLSGLPLDAGVPQSGQIGFGSFYSKRLNVVVDLYSVPENSTRLIIKSRYDSRNVTVIGYKNSTDLPQNGDGKRIIANVNKTIGSEKTGTNYCALRTGFWGSDVNLEVVVGPSGTIIGAGGDGGAGGGINFGSAGNGGTGSSALGLQYPTKVINGGSIIAGTGGGGGGAGAYGQETNSQNRCDPSGYNALTPRIGGAGGGGGRGLPSGNGGPGNSEFARLFNKQGGGPGTPGAPGGPGSVLSNGGGGAGGIIIPQDGYSCNNPGNRDARSGAGGGGGASGANGLSFRPNNFEIRNASTPGAAGPSGYAIIIDSSSGNLVSFTGNAVDGSNVVSTVQ